MDRFLTVMIIPEREKGVKTFKVPRLAMRTFLFSILAGTIFIIVLGYDYVQILRQVYENKHLALENRELKEQLHRFQLKINVLSDDLQRIEILEDKLRILSGLSVVDKSKPYFNQLQESGPFPGSTLKESKLETDVPTAPVDKSQSKFAPDIKNPNASGRDVDKDVSQNTEFKKLKTLYEQKLATIFGVQKGYRFTKEWSNLTRRSLELADSFAMIDYQFTTLEGQVDTLELDINALDELLLDKQSILRSTPTLLPTRGWITSYYGPRMSPYSARVKMHEGLDIGAQIGTQIHAPADGVVTYSGAKPGFGNTLQIDHGYGLETIYAHAKSLKVKRGQHIERGEYIAQVGNTGYSTGPHLHYEVRVNGIPVDPLYYILD